MIAQAREPNCVPSASFPSVSIPSRAGGLPVEVCLISQLGIGAGDAMIAGALARQQGHDAFIDELDEPSARLGGMDLARNDPSSLYSFAVGAQGHPFHRHAGNRIFTAVSGSAGTQLRFSTASPEQLEKDPQAFVRALQQVNIPPDSLFTVRFGGQTWHQFVPLHRASPHPALFALSCHTNELGGDLPEALRQRVEANQADIPSLTQVLPSDVLAHLASTDATTLPTVALSLHEQANSPQARLCAWTRDKAGRLRAALVRLRLRLTRTGGYRSQITPHFGVHEVALPTHSLLRTQLTEGFHHEDCFELRLDPGLVQVHSASQTLEAVLEGFMKNAPASVARMMWVRNALVKPLGLRTSPLGCPVSSLLSDKPKMCFATRFPVLAQELSPNDRNAQVILGADDKHLRFRSCVGTRIEGDGTLVVSLATRVATLNVFGRIYLAAIDRTHRTYVSPLMLRMAVDHALGILRAH